MTEDNLTLAREKWPCSKQATHLESTTKPQGPANPVPSSQIRVKTCKSLPSPRRMSNCTLLHKDHILLVGPFLGFQVDSGPYKNEIVMAS